MYLSSGLLVLFLIAACFLVAFVLGWNNSGLTTGNLSNLITYRLALALTLVGMFTGFILEGSKMTHSILGKLIVTHLGTIEILVGVSVTLILFLSLTILKIPVSLSNCTVGSFVGVSLASGASLSSSSLAEIVASWFVSPFFCMGIAILIYETVTRAVKAASLPNSSYANRLVLLGSVFYISFALGANNVGMIVSFVIKALGSNTPIDAELVIEVLIFIGIALGTVIFGKRLAEVVGDKIIGLSQIKTLSAMLSAAFVTWFMTQLSVPVSLTQVVIGGMLGAGFARGPVAVNRSELISMIWHWVAVTLLCTAAGFSCEFLITRIH